MTAAVGTPDDVDDASPRIGGDGPADAAASSVGEAVGAIDAIDDVGLGDAVGAIVGVDVGSSVGAA
jgi:hypothetical protein